MAISSESPVLHKASRTSRVLLPESSASTTAKQAPALRLLLLLLLLLITLAP
jgi:hypothetical protein